MIFVKSTRIKIKEAAAKLYGVYGFEGTTLKNIADKVGIKTPSIYNHFSSKQELFLEMYQELLEEHYLQLKTILNELKDQPPKKQLYNILSRIMSYHLHNEEKTKITTRLLLFPPTSLQEEVSEYFLKIEEYERDILREIFNRGIANHEIKKKPIDDLITHFLCIMDGLFLELHYYDYDTFLDKINIVWKYYWDGVKTESL